ncbi:hypothetical protein [[Muricauda] lutisoli]|uniref:DUF4234 domain-containing protein n=1 Tax=[Muricauda] lutisoli TaxID=2816035 RepID=A0ABS3EYM6_9FLAO|nr:hypothetical protein [[Muricauda] lutisoli]MBO0331369.1 hypothetical protein [[Muricauda] lutisoli]
MTKILLKAKHWQLFLLMIGIPLLSQIYMYSRIWMIESTSSTVESKEGFTQVLNEKFIQFDWYPFIFLLFSLLFFGWLWSLAIGLQKWGPADIHMKTSTFKVFFFIPLIYILLIISSMSGVFSGNGFLLNPRTIIAVIVPLHLFSMFCIFHSIYFAAKTLKIAELKRKIVFGDFIGEFFLLWFYFIGIWIIQPKVNKFVTDEKHF